MVDGRLDVVGVQMLLRRLGGFAEPPVENYHPRALSRALVTELRRLAARPGRSRYRELQIVGQRYGMSADTVSTHLPFIRRGREPLCWSAYG